MSQTTNSTATTPNEDLAATLADADADYREADERIGDYGEESVEAVADAYDRATDLFAKYETQATGTGRENFQKFMQFKAEIGTLVEKLPDDLPARDAFETAGDRFDKNRLNERDFEGAREDLEPAADVAGLLDERREASSRYRRVRRDVRDAIADLEDEIAERERLAELEDADLDAPVEEIRDPIESYNEAVSEAFDDFTSSASAREVLDFLAATEDYSLVSFRDPPENLREYVQRRAVGTEPISDLLTYARYSNSKLDHYVEDPAALKRAVATNETYLERLDADPLELAWPPKPAAELRWRVEELVSVLARFADDEVVAELRAVQSVVHDDERFERLRTVAEAESELSATEREKVESGAVEAELAELRDRKERLEDALAEYPDR
jgi:predicted  nucleic acid-binding Zn-ribbon protein